MFNSLRLYISMNQAIISSDNGLSHAWWQAIICENAVLLPMGPLGTNCNEIWIKIQQFLFKKNVVKMTPVKWQPYHLGLHMWTIRLPRYLDTSHLLFWIMSFYQRKHVGRALVSKTHFGNILQILHTPMGGVCWKKICSYAINQFWI